ncbi:MAG: hypothetical protein GC191_19195 [Azospirillum sp.]|nr:hypothetical protein [Azospirillum sp.]
MTTTRALEVSRVSGPRQSPTLGSPGLMSKHHWEAAIAHWLAQLEGVEAKVSLFGIELPFPILTEVEAIVVETLLPLGGVGRMGDGRIGLICFGPWGSDRVSGEFLHRCLQNRLYRRLSRRGYGHYARTLRIASVHTWTERVEHADALIEALPQRLSALSAIH